MSIVVIGKNSFIARHLKKNENTKNWIFLSHSEGINSNDWLKKATVVINCAFSPKLYTETYCKEEDIDLALALKIKDFLGIHYIMLSSRAVYGDVEQLDETLLTIPTNNYGTSKLRIEDTLKEHLGYRRLTILRLSNIFGEDSAPHTFLGQLLLNLTANEKIIYSMSANTQKDFLPVQNACSIIVQTSQTKPLGIYNVGAGTSISCGMVAEWLIEGYGKGSLEVLNDTIKGQFFMDTSKIKKTLKVTDTTLCAIQKKCIEIGRSRKV